MSVKLIYATVPPIVREVWPAEGDSFTLEEKQRLVGGYIEIAELADGQVMVLDEDGKVKDRTLNHKATKIYREGRKTEDYIVGDVLVGDAHTLGLDK